MFEFTKDWEKKMNDIEKLENKVSDLEDQISYLLMIIANIADDSLNGVDIDTNDRAHIGRLLQKNGVAGY